MTSESTDLASALEGFGLSEYEARAYIALIKEGPLLLSELAFHAQIPRTKSYATIKGLARKRLATLVPGKPVRCQGVAPEDSLDKLVSDQERKVKSMKKVVLRLRQLEEEMKRPFEMEEGRHLILSSRAIAARLPELISSARHSIRSIVDGWGFGLLEMSRDAVLNACIGEVEFKVVRVWSLEENGWDRMLPGEPKIRISRFSTDYNLFLFDDTEVLTVDRNTGKGILLHSRDHNSILDRDVFTKLWNKSVPLKSLANLMTLKGGEDVLDLLSSDGIDSIFSKAVSSTVRDEDHLTSIGVKFIERLEDEIHINLFKEPLDAVLPLLTTLLVQSLGDGASVRYDPVTNLLTVESPSSGTGIPESVWIFAVAGLLKRNGLPFVILQNVSYPEEKIHILQAKISASPVALK